MSVLILVLVLVGLLLRAAYRKDEVLLASLGVVLCFLLAVGGGVVPNFLLNSLQVGNRLENPQWQDGDLIVLLGSGMVRWPESGHLQTHPLGMSRVYEAARLYDLCKQSGKKCRILTSGGGPQHLGESEAQILKRELMGLGVEAGDVVEEVQSNNTFKNAEFSSRIIAELNPNRVTLVTSGFHMMRAKAYFAHFGVNVNSAPSDRLQAIWSIIPLAHNLAMTDLAIHEWLGIWRMRVYNFLGLNSRGTDRPGSI